LKTSADFASVGGDQLDHLLQGIGLSNETSLEVSAFWLELCKLSFKKEDGYSMELEMYDAGRNHRIVVYEG
jgi:hypothetical protein